MVKIPGRRVSLQSAGSEIEGGATNMASMCSIHGRIRRAASTSTRMRDQAVLHRQISRHQRAVQAVSRRHALSRRATRSIFCATGRTEGQHVPAGWENKPVTWVSLEDARAYAAVGGQAPAARVGVAVRRARHRRPRLSLGQSTGCLPTCPRPDTGRTMRGAGRRRCASHRAQAPSA